MDKKVILRELETEDIILAVFHHKQVLQSLINTILELINKTFHFFLKKLNGCITLR